MLLPIGHDQGVRRMPYVTIGIIVICTLVQIYSTFAAPGEADLERLFRTAQSSDDLRRQLAALMDKIPVFHYGYHTGSGFGGSMLTSAFVHDGWFHLIGNMLFLWIAGSAVEDRWGHIWYGLFYLAGAVASVYAFELTYRGAGTVLVGASGAISAMMGAFLIHFAKTRITFWYWWMFRTGTFDAAAYIALPLWLADQVLWAYLAHENAVVSGVAYAAHIGGFVFGAAAALALRNVLPQHAPDEERIYPEVSPAAVTPPIAATGDAQIDARCAQLVDAIETRDIATVRTLSSRTILDLARTGKAELVVDLYRKMAAKLSKVPLTDGAFVAAATAADTLGDTATFVAIAEAALVEHAGSSQMPKVMWRLAELRRDAGDVDAAIELLRTLAARFPRDAHGQRAEQALDSRGLR